VNVKNPSDLLFESYLASQGIDFDYEPELVGTSKRIDYVVQHRQGPLHFEVKQIEVPLPQGSFSQWDPYPPIRSHIHDGVKQFKGLPDSINALVFAAGPNSFVDLMAPNIVLGAMYGDFVFRVPVDLGSGIPEDAEVTTGFMPGNGKMVREHRIQNTRISAIISLHNYYTFAKEAVLYLKTDDGRTREERENDLWSGRAGIAEGNTPCVTVWENAYARRKLPIDIFRGPMDAWWTAEDGNQYLSFVGDKRRRLRIGNR
jgi:hypothetical protein